MPALGFKARFAAPILSGTKRHTIRAAIPRGYIPGHWVPLYTGLRTRSVKLIGSGLMGRPYEIRLDFDADPKIEAEAGGMRVFARDASQTAAGDRAIDDFARRDGFANWADLEFFWSENHPGVRQFTGWLLPWTEFTVEHRLGSWKEAA